MDETEWLKVEGMANIFCSKRDFYITNEYTKLDIHIYTNTTRITIYLISAQQTECKYKQKGRVLHMIWRFFCVSEEVMFRIQIERFHLLFPKHKHIPRFGNSGFSQIF